MKKREEDKEKKIWERMGERYGGKWGGGRQKSDREGARGEQGEMQTGMFLWALRKDLG